MNIIILTGNQFRHKFFANSLINAFDIKAVFSEGKVFSPASESSDDKKMTPEEKEIWDWHFGMAKDEEKKFFGSNTQFNTQNIFEIPKGEINSQEWRDKIASFKPDIIAVFGTSLLKDETIKICENGILNMHLGLSPYYRGSGTNFWPLYNNEPQYVGVTIHKIDIGIDTGPIIHQGRPNIEKGDNQHMIGNKTVIVGEKLMEKSIQELIDGTAKFYPQTNKGKLYQRKDFNVSHIPQLKQLMRSGMIDKYVEANVVNPIKVDIIE